ncbi:hypothetical protein [Enterobacter ludwigii]
MKLADPARHEMHEVQRNIKSTALPEGADRTIHQNLLLKLAR